MPTYIEINRNGGPVQEKVPERGGEDPGVNKGTIRGQQIIDHIIENLLVKPGNW